jgi:hypothetical protein
LKFLLAKSLNLAFLNKNLRMGIQLLGILFFHLCDVAELAVSPYYSLAKFGYKMDMKGN